MADRKIIIIGPCRMSIRFGASEQASASAGGNMLNAALILAKQDVSVNYISEAACDFLGNTLIDIMQQAGIDTSCIDRFPDGATEIEIVHGNDPRGVFYTKTPRESLVVKWPSVGPNDIVVFGNWFALDRRTHQAVMEFVCHAAQRNALIVYLPGFSPQFEPAITHVMPQILDNMELADIVVSFNNDPAQLFGAPDSDVCFKRNLSFYVPVYLHSEESTHSATLYSMREENLKFDIPSTAAPFGATVLAEFLAYLYRLETPDAKSLTQFVRLWKPEL